VAKIRNDPRAVAHISSCDVVFLQETLSTTPESCLLLPGFVGQHSLAIPTNRRPSRGVSSFFKISTFVDGALSQVFLYLMSLTLSKLSCFFRTRDVLGLGSLLVVLHFLYTWRSQTNYRGFIFFVDF
jgi:hypothetical protein